MEAKQHFSQAYNADGRITHMQQDLLLCTEDFISSFKQRTATRTRALLTTADTIERPHVGIVGAGLAGLRCAEVLLSEGAKVTILEGRSRVGGRVRSRAVCAWSLAEVFADTPGQPEWSSCRYVRGRNLSLEILSNALLGDLTGFMEQIAIHSSSWRKRRALISVPSTSLRVWSTLWAFQYPTKKRELDLKKCGPLYRTLSNTATNNV